MGEANAPPSLHGSPALLDASSSGPRSGRNLRQKVVDELKSVRVRKSPAARDKTRAPPPPPLELDEEQDEEEEEKTKAKGCNICERSFTVFRAKHTCKSCSKKICDDCSKNRMKLNRRLERKKGSRLCDPCAVKYMNSEHEEDALGAFPDASPALGASHSDYSMLHKGETNGLSRRHSVPAKKLASLIHTDENVAIRMGKNGRAATCHASHLRTRHWMSLLVVALLVTLRVIYYNRRTGVDGNAVESSAAPILSFVERALENLLSMKTLGTYLLGLVVFDELSRPKGGKGKKVIKKRRRRRVRSSERERTRTKSSLSDTSAASKRRAAESSAPSSPHTSQEDDLEVSVIEQTQEEEGFTLDKLVSVLEEGAVNRAPDGELSLSCFVSTCTVICGFLSVFGRATSFAGSTVGAYFTSIDHNLETWPAPTSSNTWKEQSVKAVIEHEVDLGVADVGGKKKPSSSRCLLRLLWFVQFVEACVRLTLLESTEESCYNGASRAYEETLGKRHPWLVRKGVNTALGSIPTRSHILGQLHVGGGDALEPLRKSHVQLLRVISELKAVFEEHCLTDLK